MRILAKALLMSLVAIIFASGAYAQKTKWQTLNDEFFTLKLPGKAEKSVEEGEVPGSSTTKYALENDGFFYMAAVTNTTMDMDEPLEMAEIAIGSFGETIQLDVEDQGTWKVQGSEGAWANFRNDPGGLNIEYHVVVKGQYLYQVVVGSSEKNVIGSKEGKMLAKSFKLK
jgi:hypothetical protein